MQSLLSRRNIGAICPAWSYLIEVSSDKLVASVLSGHRASGTCAGREVRRDSKAAGKHGFNSLNRRDARARRHPRSPLPLTPAASRDRRGLQPAEEPSGPRSLGHGEARTVRYV